MPGKGDKKEKLADRERRVQIYTGWECQSNVSVGRYSGQKYYLLNGRAAVVLLKGVCRETCIINFVLDWKNYLDHIPDQIRQVNRTYKVLQSRALESVSPVSVDSS